MAHEAPEDLRKIRFFIKQVETELLDFGKALRAKPYSVASIKSKLARSFPADDSMVKAFTEIEEKMLLLSKVFKLKCNFSDMRPFFKVLYYKVLNPPKQTLITDWIKRFKPTNDNPEKNPSGAP
nr:hypothetical protein [Candidatus Sigynarchaeota archaeon]